MRIPTLLLSPALAALLLATAASAQVPRSKPEDVSEILEKIVKDNAVPGMAAAIVEGDGLLAIGAAGIRARGSDVKITAEDKFHLGSCTKSMTATWVATFVEQGLCKWSSTLGDLFPEYQQNANAAWKSVTLEQLLTNRGGAPGGLDADGLWGTLWNFQGSPFEARKMLVKGILKNPPAAAPGEKFIYSNGGFAMAGAAIEQLTNKPWEDSIRERLFAPLGMTSAGFGAPGTAAEIDQPRGHSNGKPVTPGPGSDNPAAIGPAGTVHTTIADWGKYVSLHLRGERNNNAGGAADANIANPKHFATLLSAETFRKLHSPYAAPESKPAESKPADGNKASANKTDNSYAMGWGLAKRGWSEGTILTHSGSNTMWFCVTWLAPREDFAVLVTCNEAGDAASRACDQAAGKLISRVTAMRANPRADKTSQKPQPEGKQ